MQVTYLRKNNPFCTCENQGYVASSWDPGRNSVITIRSVSGRHLPNNLAPIWAKVSDKYWSVFGGEKNVSFTQASSWPFGLSMVSGIDWGLRTYPPWIRDNYCILIWVVVTWVSFSIWIFPWLWTLAWLLFILDPFSLHLSSKQPLCPVTKSSSDNRPKITFEVVAMGAKRKRIPTVWVNGIEMVISLACCPYLCLSVSCGTCFSPCPWKLSSSCWLLEFAVFTMRYFYVCVLFLQRKRQ